MSTRKKVKFTLRQIYEAMLYGVPKIKSTWWRTVFNKHKGINVITGACAIGRVAMNLGLDEYNSLTTALQGINIEYKDKKYGPTKKSLGNYIMNRNDDTDTSIEDIAEEVKGLVDLDQVIEV